MIVLHKKDIANYLDMDARLTAALQMIADGAFADLAAFRAALPNSFEITQY